MESKSIPTNNYEIPSEVYDAIERVVKERLNEGRFGYDHSKLITLQLEINDSFVKGTNQFKREDTREAQQSKVTESLLTKLESSTEPSKYNLSYEEWRMRKITEERLKKRLIMEYLKDVQSRREIQSKIEEEVEEEKMRKVHEWNEEKRQEARQRLKEFQERKRELERTSHDRRVQAEEEFKNWLRENFVQLREAKRLEKAAQRLERDRFIQAQNNAIERKQKAEEAYQKWLRDKSRQRSGSCITRDNRKPRRTAKSPLLLAYGKNRIGKFVEIPITNIQIDSTAQTPSKESISHEEMFHDYLSDSY